MMIVARIAGAVLLALGIALATFAIWMTARLLAVGGAIEPVAVVFATGCFVASAYCSVGGYRFLFTRPNDYGPLLSRTLWKVLAACFAVPALLLAAAAFWRHEYPLGVASVCLAFLAFVIVLAGRAVLLRRAPPPVFPPETSLLSLKGFTPAGFRCGIEILNDNTTPMEFVVSVLRNAFALSEADAIRTMLDIHRKGGVLLSQNTFGEAQRIADAITVEARANNHSLICRAVNNHGQQ